MELNRLQLIPNIPKRNWVWHCTEDSISKRQISILAIFEILLSIYAYWVIVFNFQWPIYLCTCIFAAPALLLRSPQSISLGVRYLKNYWHTEPLKTNSKILMLICCCIFTGIFSYSLTSTWLIKKNGWDLFLSSILSGYVAVSISISIMIAKTLSFSDATSDAAINSGPSALIGATTITFCSYAFVGFATTKLEIKAVSAAFLVAVIILIISAMIIALTSIIHIQTTSTSGQNAAINSISFSLICASLYGYFFESLSTTHTKYVVADIITGTGTGAILAVVSNMIFIIPLSIIGILLRTLIIRFYATVKHFKEGWKLIPENLIETLIIIDFTHSPEVLPQAKSVSNELYAKGVWHEPSDSHLRWTTKILVLIAWYFSAIAYRWSIKASAWLWWPLIFSIKKTAKYSDTSKHHLHLREKASHISSGIWSYIFHWLPMLVIFLLLLARFDIVENSLVKSLFGETINIMKDIKHNSDPLLSKAIYISLWIVFILWLALWILKTNFFASHKKILESPEEYTKLQGNQLFRFNKLALRLERQKWYLIAAILGTIELLFISLAYIYYPTEIKALFWDMFIPRK